MHELIKSSEWPHEIALFLIWRGENQGTKNWSNLSNSIELAVGLVFKLGKSAPESVLLMDDNASYDIYYGHYKHERY